MIIGEKKEKLTFEKLFNNSSGILGDDEKLKDLEEIDLFVEPTPSISSYKIREAILESRRLGRPLTDKEMEKFKVD
jgi:hypothetical protein